MLTGGGAMMRHIQQLAEFKTGLEVRIGYPNEHLNQTEMKELSSPMYSTSIGIVIETIARMEHDEFLEASKEAEEKLISSKIPVEPIIEAPKPEETNTDNDENEGKKKKKGIDLKKIVTSFTEFFTPDENLE